LSETWKKFCDNYPNLTRIFRNATVDRCSENGIFLILSRSRNALHIRFTHRILKLLNFFQFLFKSWIFINNDESCDVRVETLIKITFSTSFRRMKTNSTWNDVLSIWNFVRAKRTGYWMSEDNWTKIQWDTKEEIFIIFIDAEHYSKKFCFISTLARPKK